MTKLRRSRIPEAWPAGMSRDVAAVYVGLSESTFQREVDAGRAPAPRRITAGRLIWKRDDLDDYLDGLPGYTATGADLTAELDQWQP